MIGSLSGLAAGIAVALAVIALAAPRRPDGGRAVPRANALRAQAKPLDRATVALCQALRVPIPQGPSRQRLRRIGGLVAVALVVAPPLAVLIVAIAWLRSRYAALSTKRAWDRAITEALPDAVDLLLLSTSAGHSLPVAHPVVARRVPPPLGDALRAAAVEADQGRPRADALVDALAPLGDRALGLGHALADHLRYGVPLAPTLERLGLELRIDRRRRAEQDARRVPVRLLGPLVACVLPAFALLTVVPLLAASLRALPT